MLKQYLFALLPLVAMLSLSGCHKAPINTPTPPEQKETPAEKKDPSSPKGSKWLYKT